MNYFFDTEFLETAGQGKARVQLISIGIVAEDGRELYLENSEFDWEQEMPDQWLKENVQVHLQGTDHECFMTPDKMADKIKEFVGADDDVIWWAYVASYDFVGLTSLFGRLIDRPKGWPIWCRDLKQLIADKGVNKADLPIQEGVAHNAVEDAKWNLAVYQ